MAAFRDRSKAGGLAALITMVVVVCCMQQVNGLQSMSRQRQPIKRLDRQPILKDSFYEDNNYIVRIRTTYNASSSVTCNGVVMDDNLVISDVTCIKYSGIANIDAKYVQVLAGETSNETAFDVDQIYINKADSKDPGTELALLKLSRPLRTVPECRKLQRPTDGQPTNLGTPVRVIGFTKELELKENRTRVGSKRSADSKYVCTAPAEMNETPGGQLLKGAALVHMVSCSQYELVGILARTEITTESIPPVKKHQDCFVALPAMMRWFEQVKSLSTLAAKNDGASTQSSVIVVEFPELDRPAAAASASAAAAASAAPADGSPSSPPPTAVVVAHGRPAPLEDSASAGSN